jgi:hypothetical protein
MSAEPIEAREAIAAAVAAWQLNGNEYLKNKEWYPEVGNIKRWENREILSRYLRTDYYSEGTISPPLVEVTEEHRAIADDIINYSKKLLFKVLAAEPNSMDYEVVMYQKLNQSTVSVKDIGYIASAPMYYYGNTRKEDLQRRLSEEKSQHVGSIGGRVVLKDFEVTRNHFSVNFQGYVVMGFCEDNLFMFFTNKNIQHIKVGDRINLIGKIKDHLLEKEKYPMTKLNYVQIEGVENETKNTARQVSHSDLF